MFGKCLDKYLGNYNKLYNNKTLSSLTINDKTFPKAFYDVCNLTNLLMV